MGLALERQQDGVLEGVKEWVSEGSTGEGCTSTCNTCSMMALRVAGKDVTRGDRGGISEGSTGGRRTSSCNTCYDGTSIREATWGSRGSIGRGQVQL